MKTDYGYIVDNKVFANSFLDIEERVIGEVKESDQETISYFVSRFEVYKTTVEKLLQKIADTDNKGSYLVKVQDLLKNMNQECALGDFEPLFNKLKVIETEVLSSVEANRLRNKTVKVELIGTLAALLTRAIVPSDLDQVEKLKSTWLRVGKASATDEVELKDKFTAALVKVEEELKSISGLTEELIETRIEQFQHLITRAKELFKEGAYKKNSKVFKEIQASVKEVGFIPQEKRDVLWQEFVKVGDDFFAKVKEEFKKPSPAKKGNFEGLLKVKLGLVKKVESLFQSPILEAVKTKNLLRAEYKKIAFLPSSEAKKADNEFYDACSFIDERSFIESLFEKKLKGDEKSLMLQKIKLVNNLIQKDLENLNNYEDNSGMIIGGTANSFANVVEKRKRELNRGLSHKKRILSLLKNETSK